MIDAILRRVHADLQTDGKANGLDEAAFVDRYRAPPEKKHPWLCMLRIDLTLFDGTKIRDACVIPEYFSEWLEINSSEVQLGNLNGRHAISVSYEDFSCTSNAYEIGDMQPKIPEYLKNRWDEYIEDLLRCEFAELCTICEWPDVIVKSVEKNLWWARPDEIYERKEAMTASMREELAELAVDFTRDAIAKELGDVAECDIDTPEQFVERYRKRIQSMKYQDFYATVKDDMATMINEREIKHRLGALQDEVAAVNHKRARAGDS